MQIHIVRDNQKYGPYSLEQVHQHLNSGELNGSDMAWYKGAPGWMRLSLVPGVTLTVNKVVQPTTLRQVRGLDQFEEPESIAASRYDNLCAVLYMFGLSVIAGTLGPFIEARANQIPGQPLVHSAFGWLAMITLLCLMLGFLSPKVFSRWLTDRVTLTFSARLF